MSYFKRIAKSMSGGVVLLPIVEADELGIPSALNANLARGVVIVVSLFKSIR